ncbi:RHS repeat protein [Undibacterium sp. CY18W]|uniref:RHS repeat protein n=1 Tax=Undibacterium hunanense TaxID=2762292 RepID=A0ABR6ZWA0_9BURK|nr:RHS repeat protein [Undibacterium hunanense]MBC3920143.1 RHS repeat protein [Undibacterium hunanense]
MHQTVLAYFATTDANSAIFQRAAGVIEQRLPSHGRAVAQVSPDFLLGMVNNVSFPGVILDIDRLKSAVASQSTGLSAPVYSRQSNQRNAAYAHLVLDKHYGSAANAATNTAAVTAASAVRILAKAASQPQTQPVYAVTSSNLSAALLNISLTADQSNDLQNAVATGYRVLLPQNPATLSGWSGQAMQIEDPQTGAGAYRLSGNLSGTATAAIFAPQGMAWLALAQPVQALASISPAITASQSIDTILASMLPSGGTGGNDNSDQIRWAYFSGQADVANGLFLARLAAAQNISNTTSNSNTACDSLSSIIAANLGTATGYDDSGTGNTDVTSVPVITSAPVTAGVAAQAYSYPVAAQDPKGAALIFSLTDAPSGMSISKTGVISWTKPVIGNFNVTVRADNGRAYAEQRYQLSVSDHALALSISLAVAPALVNLGDKVTITVLTNGGTGAISTSLAVDGQAVPLNTDGTAVLTASTAGAHQITVTAKDDLGTLTKTSLYSVKDPSDTSTPVAQITAPVDDADVTAPGIITGTASAKSLAYYQLLLRATDSSDWQEIGRGYQSVTNDKLGKLDPTQLQNGIYDLNLIVVNTNGVQTNHLITVDVNRNLKIGQFSISFEDINIQASGIPIRVTRTYDTRRKSQNLDFGYGWSVDYQNVQIRKNMILGLQWNVITSGTSVCLRPAGKRKLDITLPTGEVARFTAANKVECQTASIPLIEVQFSALPGTTSTLELVDVPTSLHADGGMLIDKADASTGTPGPWNPKNYKLTTEDNYQYFLTDGIGITRIKDPNGNTLTYNDTGVAHSNGTAIAFTRDANHHITGLTDPSGKQIRYTYSASGDLMSMTDRNGAVSSMTYDRNHGLASFTDPDGHLAARYEYDADGRLIAAYDANGKAIQMNHDIDNNRETVTDRRGYKTTYTYDAYGNVTQIINPLNQITTYTYDANGNQASVTNAAGQTTLSSYDPKSYKQTSETDPLGHVNRWRYDSQTRTQLLASTDANGNSTSYLYGSDATLITQPLGSGINLRNDSAGNVTIVNVAGQITQYQYDAKGNKVSETDAAGKVITYAYDANGKEISRSWIATVNVNGTPAQKTVSVTRVLDNEGRVLSLTDALGITTKTEYTAGGQVSANVDPQGRRTSYQYDSTGKLVSTTYPDGSSTSSAYDAGGNKASDTDRQGRTTRYEYDALNRLVRTIAADGSTNSSTYDTAGQVASTTDAKGNTITNTYDDAGRLITLADAIGKQTKYEYDNAGNRTKITDATGKVTQFQYDALNRLTSTIYPDNTTNTTVLRADGRKQSETDQAGNTTVYGYDPAGRLNSVVQTNAATQQQTSYAYDGNGNKTNQIDAQGHTTSWTYDVNNRLVSRTLPAGQVEKFAYDLSGNQSQKTDFSNQATSYIYNNLDQIIQTNRPDGVSVANTYNGNGLISATTVSGGNSSNGAQNGQTSYQYDAQDRITKHTNPDGSYLAYAYDANGNITERSTSAGTVKYGYDANKKLISVTDASNKTTTSTYDAAGRLATTTLPNGITANYAYDPNGRLQYVLHQKANGNIVAGSRYTLAPNGQRTKIEEFDNLSTVTANVAANPVRTTSYQYDGVKRLTEELLKDRTGATVRTTDYQYDKVGNRSQKTETTQAGTEITAYSYDSNDRLVQETKTVGATQSTTSYTWDDKGNLITKTVAGQVTVYSWNADNRLIEVKQGTTQAGAITVAKYSYDALGNRVQKTEADKVTTYLTDNTFEYAQTVQESITQGSTTQAVNYVWGNGLVQQSRTGQNSYYHADGLGSTKALTDEIGNATDAYQYDAFGAVLNHAGTTQNAYRYTGEYYDDSISLQYNRARWYEANAGHFVSMDTYPGTIRKPASLHKYAYVQNDPVNKTDPSGRIILELLMAPVSVGTQLSLLSLQLGTYAYATKTIFETMRRLTFGSYTELRKMVVANKGIWVGAQAAKEEVHHLIEKRLLSRSPFLRTIYSSVSEMESVCISKELHQYFTNRWAEAIAKRGTKAYDANDKLTAADLIEAAELVYKDYPEYLERIYLVLL